MTNNCEELTGKEFGAWTVLERAIQPEGIKGKRTCWRVRCRCGVERVVLAQNLRSGRSRGCGCLLSRLAGEARRVTDRRVARSEVSQPPDGNPGASANAVRAEAKFLRDLVTAGKMSVVDVQDLVSIPNYTVEHWRQWSECESPEWNDWAADSIRFRQAVADAFERIVALSMS